MSPSAAPTGVDTTARSALAAARAMFAAGERIEMGPLAERLGVNRVTLYRWVGSREHLLSELIWERMERGLMLADARARRQGRTGAERLSAVLLWIFTAAGTGSVERGFVEREPALAMRVMTVGTVHDRLIDWMVGAIEEEAAERRIVTAYPPRKIAEIVVKSGEAVFWFDTNTGRGVNRENVEIILSALCPPD